MRVREGGSRPRVLAPAAIRLTAVLAAGALAVSLAGCVQGTGAGAVGEVPATSPAAPATPEPSPAPSEAPDAGPSAFLGEGVEPARVGIPDLGIDQRLVGLGIKADGTMGVPADWDAIGWFTGGGRPGGRGPTVLAGHVDSVTAPAVFHRLDELAPGDIVNVTDVDGTVIGYAVTEVQSYPKAEFPTGRVFGAVPGDELRIITCGGFFDPAAASYEDNLVVYGERVA